MYLDANNLYRWVISQYFPAGEFKCLLKDKIKELIVNRIPKDNTAG